MTNTQWKILKTKEINSNGYIGTRESHIGDIKDTNAKTSTSR
jgi:hypothetical protein